MTLKEFKVWGRKRKEKDSLYIWAKDADDAIRIARLTDQSICISQWTGNEKSYEEVIKLVKEVTGMSLEKKPCEDAVSRKAIVEYIKASDADLGHDSENEFAVEDILNMPPVTPTQQWIPCSERLPEEEGWYLVTIQNDKTRKRRTENDLFAIGIAEAHKHTPYKFCKDGHRQTVIAWMPIPEPYKAESEE